MGERFFHLWWHEEEINFYLAVDDELFITRQVEIDAAGEALAATSREEWNHERDHGDLYEYMARWGGLGEGQVLADNVPAPSALVLLDEPEFWRRWDWARQAMSERWESSGRERYERTRSNGPTWTPLKG